jgi:hypothetical protein
MPRTVFSSVSEPNNRRYVVSSERVSEDWRNSKQFLGEHIGVYHTFGDGDTQHDPISRVQFDNFEDFCISAVTYIMTEGVNGDDMLRILSSEMRNYDCHTGTVRGAMGVTYKEGKRRYYNNSDWKVSASENKQHDKRWHEIVEWMDGSLRAVIGLMKLGSRSFLSFYAGCDETRDIYYQLTGSWGPEPHEIIEWVKWNHQRGFMARDAFHALRCLVRSVEQKDQAKRGFECYQSNLEYHRKQAEEKKAETAA